MNTVMYIVPEPFVSVPVTVTVKYPPENSLGTSNVISGTKYVSPVEVEITHVQLVTSAPVISCTSTVG